MPKARPGLRVYNGQGDQGTITSITGHIAYVKWDDGWTSKTPTDSLYPLYPTGGSRWIYPAIALLLGLIIVAGLWLLTAG